MPPRDTGKLALFIVYVIVILIDSFVIGKCELRLYALSRRIDFLLVAISMLHVNATLHDALFFYRHGCKRSQIFTQTANPNGQRVCRGGTLRPNGYPVHGANVGAELVCVRGAQADGLVHIVLQSQSQL